MQESSTPIFKPPPSAMLVALRASEVEECREAVAPMPVLKVTHAHAARERMLTTRPLVVVVGDTVSAEDLEALRSTAHDIGAQVLVLGELRDASRRRVLIMAAMRAAMDLRG